MSSVSVFSVLRVLLLLTGTAALALVFVEIYSGEPRPALSAAFVSAGAYGLTFWMWGDSAPVAWVGCALLAGGFATAGRPLFASFALGALLAFIVIGIAGSVRFFRWLGTIETEPVGPDTVMPGAEERLAKFEAEGFRRVGGYSATIHGKLVIFTVLACAHADRFAVVTDDVVQVMSRFGSRFFVSTNVGSLPMPSDVLRQQPGYGTHVIPAHQAAIEVFAGQGVRPDVFTTDADVLEAAHGLEARAGRFLSDAPLRNVLRSLTKRGTDLRVIGDDDRSRRRIEAWLAAQPREGD